MLKLTSVYIFPNLKYRTILLITLNKMRNDSFFSVQWCMAVEAIDFEPSSLIKTTITAHTEDRRLKTEYHRPQKMGTEDRRP